MTQAPEAGVVVLGMHRSGTSSTARLVNLLGVPIGDRADLKHPSPANRAGYWESNSLTAFNDRLLHALGGSWAAPPRLHPGWEHHRDLAAHQLHARRQFERVHRTRQWVWKDPRTSLTLPFWLRCLRVPPVVVMTYRHPLEVAGSLARRSRLGKSLALAAWERYLRSALFAVRGLPVYVMPYHGLMLDPHRHCVRLHSFLERHGIASRRGAIRRAAASIDRTLRNHVAAESPVAPRAGITREQRKIVAALESLVGDHDRFAAPSLPCEPERIERLLAARRRADRTRWSDSVRRGPIDRSVGALPAAPVPLPS